MFPLEDLTVRTGKEGGKEGEPSRRRDEINSGERLSVN